MNDIYKNIEEYNPNKKRKMLIVFDDMIADMLSNKKRNPIYIEVWFTDQDYKPLEIEYKINTPLVIN